MEADLKQYNKKKKKEKDPDIPENVHYPKVKWVNEGVYYKKISHPFGRKEELYVSSFDIFPLISLSTTSNYDTPRQIASKMHDLILLVTKIDAYNHLKPVNYSWSKDSNGDITVDVIASK